MTKHKWLEIAKNEYRITINRIRKIKKIFPYLVIILLGFYLVFFVPTIVNLFLDDLMAFFISQLAVTMIPILLFTLFIYLIILPITYTLQGMQAGQIEIFLAAPIKPNDILLGEFLGTLPFYTIAITIIAGFFTAALAPLGIDILQISIIILVFVLISLSALWIGTIISALLRTKFTKSARGRDIGKALSLLLAMPVLALIYAIMGGGLFEILADPGTNTITRTILAILPTSWGADIITSFAIYPGNFLTVAFETFTRFGALIVFFITIIWLGTKAANRAYSIEPTSFSASKVKSDGIFYKTIRKVGGEGSFGTLLVTVFKDYVRRLENLSRIFYIIGLIVMVSIFFGDAFQDLEGTLILGQFLFPFLAVLTVGQITISGKEGLFLYKKTPFGLGGFIKTKLIQSLLITIPIAIAIISFSIIQNPNILFFESIAIIGFAVQLIGGNVFLALGLSLINPEFSENARAQMVGLIVNAQVSIFASIGVFIASSVILDLQMFFAVILQSIIIWILGITFLIIGKRKINDIE